VVEPATVTVQCLEPCDHDITQKENYIFVPVTEITSPPNSYEDFGAKARILDK